MHANSLGLFEAHGLHRIRPGDLVLEIGPDWLIPGGMVRPRIEGAGGVYAFCDIKNTPGGVSMADEYAIETPDGTFDVVVALSVAEHVRKLWTWLRELKRVVRPGGLVILVNPVSWPYHPSPHDCWRIFPEGYKALFEEVGLDHVESWTGNVAPLEPWLRDEHGPHQVTDTIAIGRRPA